jgi:hypothetical protein
MHKFIKYAEICPTVPNFPAQPIPSVQDSNAVSPSAPRPCPAWPASGCLALQCHAPPPAPKRNHPAHSIPSVQHFDVPRGNNAAASSRLSLRLNTLHSQPRFSPLSQLPMGLLHVVLAHNLCPSCFSLSSVTLAFCRTA